VRDGHHVWAAACLEDLRNQGGSDGTERDLPLRTQLGERGGNMGFVGVNFHEFYAAENGLADGDLVFEEHDRTGFELRL